MFVAIEYRIDDMISSFWYRFCDDLKKTCIIIILTDTQTHEGGAPKITKDPWNTEFQRKYSRERKRLTKDIDTQLMILSVVLFQDSTYASKKAPLIKRNIYIYVSLIPKNKM